MGSDRARVSYDEQRQYRAVIMQQGRVTVEADWNEEWQIVNEETRKEVLDIVGPCGTPNDGYGVVAAEQSSSPLQPYDFSVTKGTMYVGGLRAYLPQDVLYSQQSDWVDNSSPISTDTSPEREFIYLSLREQEVGAVEDTVLREVALGGPDTAQRLRLVQRITRMNTDAQDCETALAKATNYWASLGYTFVPHDDTSHDMRLMPSGTLQVSFQNVVTTPDPCEPQTTGGYLGADNQLIRVQISQVDAANNNYSLLWGYDNASFLYRVTAIDDKTLKLASSPIDDFHKPRLGQAVEVLRSAVKLDTDANDTTDYMASSTGFVTRLHANYDASTGYVSLDDALLAEFTNTTETPVLFLRVWEEELSFIPGTPIPLGDSNSNVVTGMQVTIQVDNGEFLGVGTYWQIAVRPDTPTEVYPHRYLESPQPPHGPRIWVCPLAVIAWDDKGNLNLLADCRNHFDNLVDLSRIKQGGCCTISVRPEDVTPNNTLQHIIDKYKHMDKITVCLMPGTYNLTEPLRFGPEHSNLTLESCHDGAVLQVAPEAEKNFLDGMIVLNRANNVTISGLRFELPQVPFEPSNGKIANMEPATTRRIAGTFLSSLNVSIGIRVLHCALLTIQHCLFRYSLTPDRDVFGAGIFANSECWGLTVRENRFIREEDYLRLRENPFRMLVGYLLSPATVFNLGKRGSATSKVVQAGSLVRALLQDAAFEDNMFAGLSIAVLIYSDAGVVKFERNTIRDCYAGFWLLSLRSLAFTSFLDDVIINKDQQSRAQQLYQSVTSVVLDPIIQFGSVLARGYPLPQEFDLTHAVQVAEHNMKDTVGTEQGQIQTLVRKALAMFEDMVTTRLAETPPASVEPSSPPAEAAPPTSTEAQATEAAPPTSTEAQAKTENTVKLSEVTKLPDAKVKNTTFTSRLNALNLHLSAFERAAFTHIASQRGLHLSLHLADNDINATVTGMTSGVAVVIWDDERESDSMLTMSVNKIRNRLETTALVLMIDRCTITGNLILNEQQPVERLLVEQLQDEQLQGLSLVLYPNPSILRGRPAGVAITGNVFQGQPTLPPRLNFSNVPSPMNTWEFLNTVI